MSTRPKDASAVAEILRERPPALDDLARARLEKKVLERREPARSNRGAWIAGGSVLAIAAAALLFILWPRDGATSSPIARFEQHDAHASILRGTLEEGSTLETSGTEVADIRIADSRVHIAQSSRVHIDTLSPTHLALALESGTVRVGFHPRQRGREHLTIDTDLARVEVVGTEFRVTVDGDSTTVSVSEGIVRVVPREGEVRFVRAGEETRVGGEVHSEARILSPQPPPEEAPVVAPDMVRENPRARFAEAERLVQQGRMEDAMRILRTLTRSSVPSSVRADAWTLTATIHMRASAFGDAASALEEAARAGRGTLAGENAIYDLARMQQQRLNDPVAARATYERYLAESPEGAHATQVRRALCRLGVSEHCGDPP